MTTNHYESVNLDDLSIPQAIKLLGKDIAEDFRVLCRDLGVLCDEEIKVKGSQVNAARWMKGAIGILPVAKPSKATREEWLQEVIHELTGGDSETPSPAKAESPDRQEPASTSADKEESRPYALDFLNTSIDWVELLPKLPIKAKGSLCFYGPPGTGKTALGHEIARQLGRPLLIKRGSDFLSRWVGETESNLAAAFKEAADTGAVLLIDEVDGMLFDRREASKGWELTQVNEFLCRMEEFDGLLICSTNNLQWLDQASLRRFSLKCEFFPLKAEQSVRLFDQWCERLPEAMSGRVLLHGEIRRLNKLTPGDFVAAHKRLSLFGRGWSAADLAAELSKECAAKGGAKTGMGFI